MGYINTKGLFATCGIVPVEHWQNQHMLTHSRRRRDKL